MFLVCRINKINGGSRVPGPQYLHLSVKVGLDSLLSRGHRGNFGNRASCLPGKKCCQIQFSEKELLQLPSAIPPKTGNPTAG